MPNVSFKKGRGLTDTSPSIIDGQILYDELSSELYVDSGVLRQKVTDSGKMDYFGGVLNNNGYTISPGSALTIANYSNPITINGSSITFASSGDINFTLAGTLSVPKLTISNSIATLAFDALTNERHITGLSDIQFEYGGKISGPGFGSNTIGGIELSCNNLQNGSVLSSVTVGDDRVAIIVGGMSYYITNSSIVPFGGEIYIQGIKDPIADQDAANKRYVDSKAMSSTMSWQTW